MSLELPYSVRVLSTEPLDEKYLNGTIPYTSVAQVNSILLAGIRSIGLTVNIANQEYWYKDNITDGGLILKTPNLANKADLVNGTVPSSQLPSYVDDVIEVANLAALPTTGETGKIYVTIDTNKTYRWSGTVYIEISAGVSDHTLLSNIGTNTHAQIDIALTRLANTSGTNTGDQDLSNYALDAEVLHKTGDETKEGKLFFLYNYDTGEPITGDFLEGLTSLNSAPPTTQFRISTIGDVFAKTLEIEGNATASQATLPEHLVTAGQLNSADEFYFDANSIFRPNISTYRQIEIATQINQTFTLDFEPTFFYSVLKDGISLLQSQYVYTAPNQIQILSNTIGQTIEMTYDKFIIQP